MAQAPQRCTRCYVTISNTPTVMAGRVYCCESCSVGSACEHQGIRRAANVRRYDTMFAPFRAEVRHAGPFEADRKEE